eukprot:12735594-Alexandrium_andersonii.AAC.1
MDLAAAGKCTVEPTAQGMPPRHFYPVDPRRSITASPSARRPRTRPRDHRSLEVVAQGLGV